MALILVVLITAVIAIIVISMSTRQQVEIRRTLNVLDRHQAYLFTEGAEGWAKRVLAEDKQKGGTDNLLEDWAMTLPPLAVEGGEVAGQLRDLQGCFNLNNLVNNNAASAADLGRYRRLLAALQLDTGLADAAVDWLDADSQLTYPFGAESDYYGRLDAPYAIANRAMVSATELYTVKGYTAEVMAALGPTVCALPKRTKVNVNTAPPVVLMTLAPGVTEAIVAAILQARDQPLQGVATQGGFKSLQELLDVAEVKALLANRPDLKAEVEAGFDVHSDFFLLQTEASFGAARMLLYSLLERVGSGVVTHFRAQGSY